MTLNEATQWLLGNGYMVEHKKRYKVTQKFYEDMGQPGVGALPAPTITLNNAPVSIPKDFDWKALFIRFILEAEVPKWGRTSGGDHYPLNQYSEAGMKAFRKALEKEGADHQTLLESVKLYYKSKNAYHKAIGNYFAEGHWVTGYEALKDAKTEAVTTGNLAPVISHLKDSTQANGTAYEIG